VVEADWLVLCSRARVTADPGLASNITPATTAAPADVAANSR
jgi:hypothetical protein